MTHYVTNVCGWAAKTTKNVYSSVCTKGTDIAGYLHITSCAQACATKATQCWTDHNSELKYAIVAGSTALLTSGWGIMPLIAGGGAFAVTKGFKNHTAAVDAVANGIKNQHRAVSNFVFQKTRNFIHYWRLTNEQIHNEIVAAIAAKDIAKLLTLSKYIHLLSEEERSNAVIAFSELPLPVEKEVLLSSLLNGRLNNAAINDGLKFAIQQNKPDLIKILLKNNELTHPQRLAALTIACTPGTSTEIINELLSQGIDRFTEEERSAAVSELSKLLLTAEKEVILSSLLNCTLNNDAITVGLQFAIKQKKPNLIKTLLLNNRLTKPQLLAALKTACTPGMSVEVINELLSQGIAHLAPESAEFKDALFHMADNGHELAFIKILDAVNFSKETGLVTFNKISTSIRNNKKTLFISKLNEKMPNIGMLRDYSCLFAIRTENESLLNMLQTLEPKLTPEQQSKLIINLTSLTPSQFITNQIFNLLKNPGITDDAKSKSLPLVVDAISTERLELEDLRLVLREEPQTRIDESDLKKAIQTACMKGNSSLLCLLVTRFPSINRLFKTQLFGFCSPFKTQLLGVCHPSIQDIVARL